MKKTVFAAIQQATNTLFFLCSFLQSFPYLEYDNILFLPLCVSEAFVMRERTKKCQKELWKLKARELDSHLILRLMVKLNLPESEYHERRERIRIELKGERARIHKQGMKKRERECFFIAHTERN